MVIVKVKEKPTNREIRLVNGMILLQYTNTGAILRKLLVISYRNNKGKNNWSATHNYCSFIDLETGQLALEHPIDRKTNHHEILCLLNKALAHGYEQASEKALVQALSIHDLNEYDLEIQVKGGKE